MATFTDGQVRRRAQQKTGSLRDANTVLNEVVASAKKRSTFDVFLSHSRSDAQIILGVKAIFEDYAKTVYVDWVDDPLLDRKNVTSRTAEIIRRRMRRCKSLVYVHSSNSGSSKWMLWELGYFDGYSGAVAILPITKRGGSRQGQEYLGIYPYIDEAPPTTSSTNELWVNRSGTESKQWDTWLSNQREFRKTS